MIFDKFFRIIGFLWYKTRNSSTPSSRVIYGCVSKRWSKYYRWSYGVARLSAEKPVFTTWLFQGHFRGFALGCSPVAPAPVSSWSTGEICSRSHPAGWSPDASLETGELCDVSQAQRCDNSDTSLESSFLSGTATQCGRIRNVFLTEV